MRNSFVVGIAIASIAGCTDGTSRQQSSTTTRVIEIAEEPAVSETLRSTVVVPTRSSRMPKGQNVAWCGCFELAWRQLKDATPPPGVDSDVWRELCNSKLVPSDVPSNAYFESGRIGQGIVERIRQNSHAPLGFKVIENLARTDDQGYIVHATLQARVSFKTAFFEIDEAARFIGKDGQSMVKAFGIRGKDAHKFEKLRDQVEVLFASGSRGIVEEFALDLCKSSASDRVVVALVRPEPTLERTIAAVEERIANSRRVQSRVFGPCDELSIPVIRFQVMQEFEQLKGATAFGQEVVAARQEIGFQLDRGGAMLKTEAAIVTAPIPRLFIVDRPFLVLLQRRGAGEPYFALWVNNSEALARFD